MSRSWWIIASRKGVSALLLLATLTLSTACASLSRKQEPSFVLRVDELVWELKLEVDEAGKVFDCVGVIADANGKIAHEIDCKDLNGYYVMSRSDYIENCIATDKLNQRLAIDAAAD